MGWCPSGRLFEAAACGSPIVSDNWEGLDRFFVPGREIAIARDTPDVLAALEMGDADLAQQAKAARERTLAEHTSMHRARQLLSLLEDVALPQAVGA
jgi:spore maturation protein CgeB